MKFPKLVIASNGHHTAALIDGVFIGKGIERLDFSSETKDGEMESTIRVMDLNVEHVKMLAAKDFDRFMEAMSRETPTAPAATGAVEEVME